MAAIFGLVPKIYEFGKWLVEVDERHGELKNKLEELESKVEDMDRQVTKEEAEKPVKKRKRVIDAYFKQVKRYKESTERVLEISRAGPWKVKHMCWLPCIERHQREGEKLLSRGCQLIQEGLTYNSVTKRGQKLPVGDQFVCDTTRGLLESALQAMKTGVAQCIGIYGSAGAGKTNLMKCLYNEIYDDKEGFKAVFWATAPEVGLPDHTHYNKALQKCVADGMCIDLNNYHNEATRAGRIMARLQELGQGRAVLFLDNVEEEFSAYELLGLPSLASDSSSSTTATESESELDAACYANCILVFSTQSKEVCDRMQCDFTLKMDLLHEKEAQELFLHEIRQENDPSKVHSNQEQKIQQLAIQVANQCARMPLAIILIARSMAGIKDLREWRNRLNELKGAIASIHDNDAKILEQLEFGFMRLTDSMVQLCFLAAAEMLADDRQVSKLEIIQKWRERRLIGMDRQGKFADDQGHVILNQLERMCLLQVAPDQKVTMNKWIRKMAKNVKNKFLCQPSSNLGSSLINVEF